MAARVIDSSGLESLLTALRRSGYDLIGPTVRDQAIVYDHVSGTDDLPRGITDTQEAGHYRIEERSDESLFGFNAGPSSPKDHLYPSHDELFSARREDGRIRFTATVHPNSPRFAFIGVRACELAAIAIQDRVLLGTEAVDLGYSSRRAGAFMVAVNCVEAGGTCFCDSMGTGPRATEGFDLVLTEVTPGAEYVIETGTSRGAQLLASIESLPAGPAEEQRVERGISNAVRQMGRRMETDGLQALLVDNPEHPRWDQVADRCLTCGNCTMACPTCFCSTTEDRVTLDGEALRTRRWDSCFGLDFSSLHGHSVRASARSRYRQWLTHKLGTWHDQFGMSGCVGCGRCITWCPVGIDITEEVAAMRGQVS